MEWQHIQNHLLVHQTTLSKGSSSLFAFFHFFDQLKSRLGAAARLLQLSIHDHRLEFEKASISTLKKMEKWLRLIATYPRDCHLVRVYTHLFKSSCELEIPTTWGWVTFGRIRAIKIKPISAASPTYLFHHAHSLSRVRRRQDPLLCLYVSFLMTIERHCELLGLPAGSSKPSSDLCRRSVSESSSCLHVPWVKGGEEF